LQNPLPPLPINVTGELSEWAPEFFSYDEMLRRWRAALERRGKGRIPSDLQVYVNFPYCRSRCSYCMYWSCRQTRSADIESYIDHLMKTVNDYRQVVGPIKATSAYFGGGTPSLVPAAFMERFLKAFSSTFRVEGEFTCEAHPDTLDEAEIRVLAKGGINRLSLGIQSFDPDVQLAIGRKNPEPSAIEALIGTAQKQGIEVNVDLITGLPRQTLDIVRNDLETAFSLKPDTIFLYRYQNRRELAGETTDSLPLSRILATRFLPKALQRGYVYSLPVRDEKFYKGLFRCDLYDLPVPFPRLAWLVRFGLQRVFSQSAYTSFDKPRSFLLGLGTGAGSHLYGFARYRDVTLLNAGKADHAPIYRGTRFSTEEEGRIEALDELLRGRWVDPKRFEGRDGRNAGTTFPEFLRSAEMKPYFQWKRRRVRKNPDCSEEVAHELMKRLLPPPSNDSDHCLNGAWWVYKDRIQRDLVLGGLDSGPTALEEFCRLLGIEGPGRTWRGAHVEQIGIDLIAFRLPDDDAAALPLRVAWRNETESFYAQTKRFNVSWVARGGEALLDSRNDFLKEMCKALRRAEKRSEAEARASLVVKAHGKSSFLNKRTEG